MTKIPSVILTAACAAAVLFGCSSGTQTELSGAVDKPSGISTLDEAQVTENPTIRTESKNVNGMCFAITLEQFTTNYNEMLKEMGNLDMLNPNGWKTLGDPEEDSNGVEYQYYYYDADKINFTATVETSTSYLMNIGLGTTMSSFVAIDESGTSAGDEILMKSAVMAASAGGMTIDKVDTLQDIFYYTTLDGYSELWYEGNVYALSISEDKSDSEKSTMLFRTFPISDEVKSDWNISEYENVAASQAATKTAGQ